MDELGKFLAAMFALSVGVERLVEILKNLWDSVTGKTKQRSPQRSATLQSLAAVIGTVLVAIIGPEQFVPGLTEQSGKVACAIVLGAMSSGGSAFWNDLISIVTAMKHARQSAAQIVEQTRKDVVEGPTADQPAARSPVTPSSPTTPA